MAEVRYVSNLESLIFYTNTDESDYPVFITDENEIWLKARPYSVSSETDEYGYERKKRVYDKSVKAVFFVKSVSETDENIEHPLLETAINVIKEVTKNDVKIKRLKILYEIYKGDMEKLVGETIVSCVKVVSAETPFSGRNCASKKAWAIGYDWKKRIIAKAPELEKYTYLTGVTGRRDRAYVNIVVKLPISNPDFEKLFNIVISEVKLSAFETQDLQKKISEIETAIEEKKKEIETLERELSRLKMQLELETTKQKLIEEAE